MTKILADHAGNGPMDRPILSPVWSSVRSRPAGAGRAPGSRPRRMKPVLPPGYRSVLDRSARRDGARPGTSAPAASSPADHWRRQSELLDEALKHTFPASDPVSVARVE
jgi:hypothetical protein